MFRKLVLSTTAAVLASSVALATGSAHNAAHPVEGKKAEELKADEHGAGIAKPHVAHEEGRKQALEIGGKNLEIMRGAKLDRASAFGKKVADLQNADYVKNNPTAMSALIAEAANIKVHADMTEAEFNDALQRLASALTRATGKEVKAEDLERCAI